jgi:hypothetical protein
MFVLPKHIDHRVRIRLYRPLDQLRQELERAAGTEPQR